MSELSRLALEFAIKEMDAGAGEIGRNNGGSFVEKYVSDLAEIPTNWCAAFCCWCFLQASERLEIKMPFTYVLMARVLMNQFKVNKNLEFIPTNGTPETGDLIFFWREKENSPWGHVEIVEEVSGKFIHTVAGNRGKFPAKVSRQYYPTNTNAIPTLLGYGRVK